MKTRLNLTIEDSILKKMKNYAQKHHTSVSQLVENYFAAVVTPAKRKNIIDLVEELEKPVLDEKSDLKEHYYKERGTKYGF